MPNDPHQLPTINVIGAGAVAQTLLRLWVESAAVRVGGVVNRSLRSAQAAIQFIGQGRAVERVDQLELAELWLIGSNDDEIERIGSALAQTQRVREGDVVFHLSGAWSSRALAQLEKQNAWVGSLHPLKSFPTAQLAYANFGRPYFAVEGQAKAIEVLASLSRSIGCPVQSLSAHQKQLYHIANTILSNSLVALAEIGLDCYRRAGIAESQARQMVEPLMTQTLENVLTHGPQTVLTGPISRGDVELVRRHLTQLPEASRAAYRALGLTQLRLAQQGGKLDQQRADAIEQLLDGE